MLQSINKILLLMLLVAASLVSCNSGPTLQKYYVDNELKPGFLSQDIPTSFLNIEETTLNDEQKEAYKSVDKLNMISFVVSDDNKDQFEVELSKVKTILEDSKYDELMRGGNATDGKFIIKFLGEPENIDELILFGYSNEKGFAIIRILGDDMNAGKLVKLGSELQNMDMDDKQLQQFMDFFQ
ncbi:MAG: DUF4252 domain-containing protein [Bacteroidia bacterium]|nr:DUF4252 domain-containing protein [Bacteroidia bacterium]